MNIRDLKVLIIFQNKQEGLVDAICPQMVLQCDSLEPGLHLMKMLKTVVIFNLF